MTLQAIFANYCLENRCTEGPAVVNTRITLLAGTREDCFEFGRIKHLRQLA